MGLTAEQIERQEREAILRRAWVNTNNELRLKRLTVNHQIDAVFEKTAGKLVDKIKSLTISDKFEFEEAKRLINVGNEVKRIANTIGLELVEDLDASLIEMYKSSYYRNAWALDISTPNPINFGQISDKQVQAILATPFSGGMFSKRLFEITNEMAYQIQNEIASGMIAGQDLNVVAQNIFDIFGDVKKGYWYRAKLIARTETIKARELARKELYRQNADIIEREIWVNMESACPECEEIARRHNEDGETYLEPVVDTHPNCVCTKTIELKPFETVAGVEENYQPFEAWAEENIPESEGGEI